MSSCFIVADGGGERQSAPTLHVTNVIVWRRAAHVSRSRPAKLITFVSDHDVQANAGSITAFRTLERICGRSCRVIDLVAILVIFGCCLCGYQLTDWKLPGGQLRNVGEFDSRTVMAALMRTVGCFDLWCGRRPRPQHLHNIAVEGIDQVENAADERSPALAAFGACDLRHRESEAAVALWVGDKECWVNTQRLQEFSGAVAAAPSRHCVDAQLVRRFLQLAHWPVDPGQLTTSAGRGKGHRTREGSYSWSL